MMKMNRNTQQQPIGIFDSGVGGLSVLKAIRQAFPYEDLLYFGDQVHVPYGPRPAQEIQELSIEITHFLLMQGAKIIVVACNTVTAAALRKLRRYYQEVLFVGMEPAVKPAAEMTITSKIGVLATPATFSSDLYTSLVRRFGKQIQIYTSTCPGLVEQVEKGELNTPKTRGILEAALNPMIEEGIDNIVMGCTHFPFVTPLIQVITGPSVHIIDPAPAIARQTHRLLKKNNLLNPAAERGQTHFYTSAEPENLAELLPLLFDQKGTVFPVRWAPGPIKKILAN
jgi:glutamate racemase